MGSESGISIGFVGTYPPTVCGIATYTASLVEAVTGDRDRRRVGVVGLSRSGDKVITLPPVVFQHCVGDVSSLRGAIQILNGYDTVSVQHEFGIFGGRDGAEVIDLLSGLTVPTAVTLHTVLAEPTPSQRAIIDRICRLAERLIVMSETAAARLVDNYGIDPDRISVIAHGADPAFAGGSLSLGDRPLVLTWGLIGPGKGLESAIESFADLTDLDPLPRYLIAGATHPNVKRESGESYRQSLITLVDRLGLEEIVEFDDRYLERAELATLVRSANLVVLPYQSQEQVTSGVLVEAIAASKPVIATPFPHAVEILSRGPGLIVPHGRAHELAAALRRLLTDPSSMTLMTRRAEQLAADWYWPTIGREFAGMMTRMARRDELLPRLAAAY